MTEQVSLRALISQVLSDTDIADPREVAVKVAAMIPPEQTHHVLVDALVADVRTVMGARRNAAMSHVLDGSHRPARSAKVAGIRDWWSEMLAARVHVGSGAWMALGDCGEKELAFAEAERRADAAREMQRAEMYEQLRTLLRKHKVRTVSQLPADVARRVAA